MFGCRHGFGKKRRNRDIPPRECICPQCNMVVNHKRGEPCYKTKCPECGNPLMGRLNTENEK